MDEKTKILCQMASRMFPEIYKNRRACSHDSYDEIVNLVANTTIKLFNKLQQNGKTSDSSMNSELHNCQNVQ